MFKLLSDLKRALDFQHAPIQIKLTAYQNKLDVINDIHLENMADIILNQYAMELRAQAINGIPLGDLMAKAYALVREVAGRVLNQRPYDTQVLAGMALHDGRVVEMMTGEGKTLAAVFPAYLNALNGKSVHILTFNDYLAERDATWMEPLYRFLNLSVGYINGAMGPAARQAAYACDVTYVTAQEAGFDYLRNFLCYDPKELIQRPFNMAIVDEADSILIDEGRIPLVIAEKCRNQDHRLAVVAALVRDLHQESDYLVDAKQYHVNLTDKGISQVEKEFGISNLYISQNAELVAMINNALYVRAFLKRDVDYIMHDDRVELLDEFTGRLVPDRYLPNGLQEALEAQEGMKRTRGGRILGMMTMQHFLNAYPKLAGMTGTARAAADAFKKFYNLNVTIIPPYRPCIRVDEPDLIFPRLSAKIQALIKEIGKIHATGQPILIGTCNVRESEQLAALVKQAGIKCRVLNAKNDAVEAEIIAEAGRVGAVTIATNMAGRGTDIRLGGKAGNEYEKVKALGGLYIIGTSHFENSRVDDQLRGRAARQGDPGKSRFFICLEDELLVRFGIAKLLSPKYFQANSLEPLSAPEVQRHVIQIQRTIMRQNEDIRGTLWQYAWIIERERQKIQQWRQAILQGQESLQPFENELAGRYLELRLSLIADTLHCIVMKILLYQIDEFWANFLEWVTDLREVIYLEELRGKFPLAEFYRVVSREARDLRIKIEAAAKASIRSLKITSNGIDLVQEGMKRPLATWSYMINDMPFERKIKK